MPINASILSELKAPQFRSPLDVAMTGLQLKNAIQQGQQQQLGIQGQQLGIQQTQAQMADQDLQRQRSLKIQSIIQKYGGDIESPDFVKEVGGVDPNLAIALQQHQQTIKTSKAAQAKDEAEAAKLQNDVNNPAPTIVPQHSTAIDRSGRPLYSSSPEPPKHVSSYVNDKGEHVDIFQNEDGTLEPRVAGQVKPDKPSDMQRYADLYTKSKKGTATPDELTELEGFGKAKTLAGTNTFNLQQSGKNDARNDRSYQFNVGELNKSAQPVSDAIGRMGRLQDSLAENTPQADALIGPELLSVMAGGAGSGLRMNEAEIARVIGGRSNWETLKASINKWSADPSAARSITPAQQQQIRALVQTVATKLTSKQQILENARQQLIDAESPEDHRRIVAEAKQRLAVIDQGGAAPAASPAPAGPKQGDRQSYQGHDYLFDGKQWVRQ